MENVIIRNATLEDATAIQAIYAPYVENTAITFEYDVPSVEEMRGRIENTLKEYPYIVAECDGEILGYAYAGQFHGREAYRHSVETSIYIKNTAHGRGLGKALYNKLEEMLLAQNVYILYACITSPEEENTPHLTDTSVRFHEHLGYKLIGKHLRCGYKFDYWYSIVWMERIIAPLPAHPEPFIPITKL